MYESEYDICSDLCGSMVYGWQIAMNASRNKAFSVTNESFLKTVKCPACKDAVVYLAGNIVLWLMNMKHPGAMLQEENDLTIQVM